MSFSGDKTQNGSANMSYGTNITEKPSSNNDTQSKDHQDGENNMKLSNKSSVLDLFRIPEIRKYTLVMFYLW